ncbi:hypothetical protein ACIBHY_53880 [Nonomuraea sp. NPDC050547]|uniref:hypothetical protein n=1 Tax=Nonomuraea sp. NPDC050547 TaxID=3364368 RepID=UPI0037933608
MNKIESSPRQGCLGRPAAELFYAEVQRRRRVAELSLQRISEGLKRSNEGKKNPVPRSRPKIHAMLTGKERVSPAPLLHYWAVNAVWVEALEESGVDNPVERLGSFDHLELLHKAAMDEYWRSPQGKLAQAEPADKLEDAATDRLPVGLLDAREELAAKRTLVERLPSLEETVPAPALAAPSPSPTAPRLPQPSPATALPVPVPREGTPDFAWLQRFGGPPGKRESVHFPRAELDFLVKACWKTRGNPPAPSTCDGDDVSSQLAEATEEPKDFHAPAHIDYENIPPTEQQFLAPTYIDHPIKPDMLPPVLVHSKIQDYWYIIEAQGRRRPRARDRPPGDLSDLYAQN